MPKREFTLESFAKLLRQTRKLGPLGDIMKRLPGMGGVADAFKGADLDDDIRKLLGVIDSMTPVERRQPSNLIGSSRRRRIAAGAGVVPDEVNELINQFSAMAAMMKETGTDRF